MNFQAIGTTKYALVFFDRELNLAVLYVSHCAFSSNLFRGQITQKDIDQMSDPDVALKKFLE